MSTSYHLLTTCLPFFVLVTPGGIAPQRNKVKYRQLLGHAVTNYTM